LSLIIFPILWIGQGIAYSFKKVFDVDTDYSDAWGVDKPNDAYKLIGRKVAFAAFGLMSALLFMGGFAVSPAHTIYSMIVHILSGITFALVCIVMGIMSGNKLTISENIKRRAIYKAIEAGTYVEPKEKKKRFVSFLRIAWSALVKGKKAICPQLTFE
jgi:hypothetical protein